MAALSVLMLVFCLVFFKPPSTPWFCDTCLTSQADGILEFLQQTRRILVEKIEVEKAEKVEVAAEKEDAPKEDAGPIDVSSDVVSDGGKEASPKTAVSVKKELAIEEKSGATLEDQSAGEADEVVGAAKTAADASQEKTEETDATDATVREEQEGSAAETEAVGLTERDAATDAEAGNEESSEQAGVIVECSTPPSVRCLHSGSIVLKTVSMVSRMLFVRMFVSA